MRVVRRALSAVVVLGTLWGLAQLVSQYLSEGDPDADDFTLARIVGGASRRSTASSLRRGDVLALMGGIDLDLTSATLDPAGAQLDVRAVMGGVQVTVPPSWRVTVDVDAKAGGVEASVTPVDELPADAPALDVSVIARMGGVLVTSAESAGSADGDGTA